MMLIVLSLTACGTAPNTTDTDANAQSGGSWVSSGNGSSSDTDATGDTDATDTNSDTDATGDTDTNSGTDTGTSVTSCAVSAKLGIIPVTEWDASVTNPATVNPEFSLWNVANYTTGDFDGYGVASGSATSTNSYITTDFVYCPGDFLVVGGDFNDGHQDRWLTEANGVVNVLADVENDNAKRVIVDFGDGNWQGYRIGGAMPSTGAAGWVDNGDGGGDLFVATFADVATHDDSL